MNGGEPLFFKVRKRGEDFSLQYLEVAEGVCQGTSQKFLKKIFLGENHNRVRSFFSAAVMLSLTDCLLVPSCSAISCKV